MLPRLRACYSESAGLNHIMALWRGWWRRPLLAQTHHTETVFWVTKLNILAGLFLVPSVSTVNTLHVRVCACVRARVCARAHKWVCVTASLWRLAMTAGCVWPTKSSSHGPRGLSIARRSRKEAAVIGCRPTVHVADGGAGHMSAVVAAWKDLNHSWSRMIYRFTPRVNSVMLYLFRY